MADNQSCFRFDGASLQPCEPPEWYAGILRDADNTGGDWSPILARNGVHLQPQFGGIWIRSMYMTPAGTAT